MTCREKLLANRDLSLSVREIICRRGFECDYDTPYAENLMRHIVNAGVPKKAENEVTYICGRFRDGHGPI